MYHGYKFGNGQEAGNCSVAIFCKQAEISNSCIKHYSNIPSKE